MCHEIAHSWFGLVIGAKDWTEEWISEGFATYLEDIIWAQAQQVQFLLPDDFIWLQLFHKSNLKGTYYAFSFFYWFSGVF